MIELTFAVKQQNKLQLEAHLLAISDPSNLAQYGHWLGNDEVHALLAPRAADLAAVQAHLRSHGVAAAQLVYPTPNADLIVATVSVTTAEALLPGARYATMRHNATGTLVVRCTDSGYSLPADVAAAVDFVAPTVRLPSLRGATAGMTRSDNHSRTAPRALVNNPKTLKELYSVGTVTGTGSGRNKAAVTAFLEQYYQEASLQEFYNLFCKAGVPCGMDGKASAVDTKGDAGDHKGSGTESMLDIEYITALGAGISTEFWGFSGRSPDNSKNEVELVSRLHLVPLAPPPPSRHDRFLLSPRVTGIFFQQRARTNSAHSRSWWLPPRLVLFDAHKPHPAGCLPRTAAISQVAVARVKH